jgi:hypothetical protein
VVSFLVSFWYALLEALKLHGANKTTRKNPRLGQKLTTMQKVLQDWPKATKKITVRSLQRLNNIQSNGVSC